MYESKDKMVSHPEHYQANGMEVIDVIEAFTADLKGIEATDTGNIIKYACRWNSKGNAIQDVEKIIWYATHLWEHLVAESNDIFISKNDISKNDIFISKPDESGDNPMETAKTEPLLVKDGSGLEINNTTGGGNELFNFRPFLNSISSNLV